jgi:hypothetical protein
MRSFSSPISARILKKDLTEAAYLKGEAIMEAKAATCTAVLYVWKRGQD